MSRRFDAFVAELPSMDRLLTLYVRVDYMPERANIFYFFDNHPLACSFPHIMLCDYYVTGDRRAETTESETLSGET